MGNFKEFAGWPALLMGCFFWSVVMFAGSGQLSAGQPADPAGQVLFEDKQAQVKIIKTTTGVILKIITDKRGWKTVKELAHDPTRSKGR